MKHRTVQLELRPRLSELAVEGFWFCCGCQRVTTYVESAGGSRNVCARCGSPRIKWCEPIYVKDLS